MTYRYSYDDKYNPLEKEFLLHIKGELELIENFEQKFNIEYDRGNMMLSPILRISKVHDIRYDKDNCSILVIEPDALLQIWGRCFKTDPDYHIISYEEFVPLNDPNFIETIINIINKYHG